MEFKNQRTWGPNPNYPKVLSYKRKDDRFVLQAGQCSFESKDMIWETAEIVSNYGGTHLRGHCFRAGSYPGKNFGFIDIELIKEFQKASHFYGLQNVMEVLDYSPSALDIYMEYGDSLQVGARSCQSYTLLKKINNSEKDIFLKRGNGVTVDEWLGAAEYLLKGNCNPILVERGSSTYHNDVRWTPTIHTIPSVKSITELPIIFDPSHSCGRRDMVPSLAMAGAAAGADGLLIEFHKNPDKSISDPDQAIDIKTFKETINKVNNIRKAIR